MQLKNVGLKAQLLAALVVAVVGSGLVLENFLMCLGCQ